MRVKEIMDCLGGRISDEILDEAFLLTKQMCETSNECLFTRFTI